MSSSNELQFVSDSEDSQSLKDTKTETQDWREKVSEQSEHSVNSESNYCVVQQDICYIKQEIPESSVKKESESRTENMGLHDSGLKYVVNTPCTVYIKEETDRLEMLPENYESLISDANTSNSESIIHSNHDSSSSTEIGIQFPIVHFMDPSLDPPEQQQQLLSEDSPQSESVLYSCEECKVTFTRKFSLKNHNINIHAEDRPYCCSLCEKSFPRPNNLKYHMKTHNGYKPHTCSECNKTFAHKHSLKTHMNIHTGHKPYSCEHCYKTYADVSNLRKHKKMVHSSNKPFACHNCDKSFALKGNLKLHMSVHTGSKPYSCVQCSKSFTQNSHLICHMKIHSGLKPFSCNVCSKSFTQKSYLKAHSVIHTGLKPYSCKLCDKTFSRKSYLDGHLIVHSRKHGKS